MHEIHPLLSSEKRYGIQCDMIGIASEMLYGTRGMQIDTRMRIDAVDTKQMIVRGSITNREHSDDGRGGVGTFHQTGHHDDMLVSIEYYSHKSIQLLIVMDVHHCSFLLSFVCVMKALQAISANAVLQFTLIRDERILGGLEAP